MTLEEAKKKIKAQAEAEWEEFKKTGSMLCQGFALGADDALEVLEKVGPVGNPDTLTLRELARELRKIFRFKYLTVEIAIYNPYFCLWTERPYWNGKYWEAKEDGQKHIVTDFLSFETVASIDLSEYADADGNIDYSKCIVEVTDDAE